MNKVVLFTNKVEGDDCTRIIYVETNLIDSNMTKVTNECEGLYSMHSLKDYYIDAHQGESHAFRVLFDTKNMKPKCHVLFDEYVKYAKHMINSVGPFALINDCYDITFNWKYSTNQEIVSDPDTPTVIGVVNFLHTLNSSTGTILDRVEPASHTLEGIEGMIKEVNTWDENYPCSDAGTAISHVLENLSDLYYLRESKFKNVGLLFDSYISFVETGKHTREISPVTA